MRLPLQVPLSHQYSDVAVELIQPPVRIIAGSIPASVSSIDMNFWRDSLLLERNMTGTLSVTTHFAECKHDIPILLAEYNKLYSKAKSYRLRVQVLMQAPV